MLHHGAFAGKLAAGRPRGSGAQAERAPAPFSLRREALAPYYGAMCSYCGAALPRDRKPGFNEVCEGCGRDLHACVNCRFYLPGARADCAESSAEAVGDKERRNKCEWFEADPALLQPTAGRGKERSAAEKARLDLDKLFGSGS